MCCLRLFLSRTRDSVDVNAKNVSPRVCCAYECLPWRRPGAPRRSACEPDCSSGSLCCGDQKRWRRSGLQEKQKVPHFHNTKPVSFQLPFSEPAWPFTSRQVYYRASQTHEFNSINAVRGEDSWWEDPELRLKLKVYKQNTAPDANQRKIQRRTPDFYL